ncbi:hypothetical protein SODALDRAFT_304435 [Sodiomyces alkalinus F11]|uniref:Calponin-homology (CH) domain-containing protein n=1 Tax=Sodiomyces alkalinus (strain CBS 110278 / VKM F-3762 / F11) TaxID=1314773 RepID=A0A3N2Q836_SODAK|nr:hypothetical protein SODALDRAFT_304435 [Sodiomyces alkalinus F11]ROT42828.1 hypothetical protein SODALDRAFT_304435 [Sodiomyces alkalinus F11]
MASVSSLDKDLRKLRLDRYTPAAANEVKSWIEGVLGESLPSGDLLGGLKDGVALCKLVNLAVPPPGVKFKQSAMPFVQMENISHFLRACKLPPLNLQEHDVFLTVDLYEQKDPTQVLQCIGAFSRAAHAVNPARFPSPIGPRRSNVLSPQSTGPGSVHTPTPGRDRGLSTASNTSSVLGSQRSVLAGHQTGDSPSGKWSPTKSASPVSSWSKKAQEGVTAPAWNIAQYGYMGGASQGNLGISFGGRRQITGVGPSVPSAAEKERKRREREAEEERQRQQALEAERRRKAEVEAEEERARLEEERRWEEETRRVREEERRRAEEEKKRWEEEERQWRLTEEKRRKEEEEVEARLARLAEERSRARTHSDARLRGQFLSQYQAEQGLKAQKTGADRIAELERELELARERERQYERERQERARRQGGGTSQEEGGDDSRVVMVRPRSRSRPAAAARPPSRHDSWSRDEREILRTKWNQHRGETAAEAVPSPPQPVTSPRPLPDPAAAAVPSPPQKVTSHNTGGARPLPDPTAYMASTTAAAAAAPQSRTERYLADNPAPQREKAARQSYSRELDATAERDAEDRRRVQSQEKTEAGSWASKSLLEREMEMERQRQREWEEAQKETAKAARSNDGVDGIGGGIGGRWDVGQWSGYTGGDGQNKGNQGIGAGRRQIVGPRPLPGPR